MFGYAVAKLSADQIGHTDPAFTMRLYTHLFDDDKDAAAVNLDELRGKTVASHGATEDAP